MLLHPLLLIRFLHKVIKMHNCPASHVASRASSTHHVCSSESSALGTSALWEENFLLHV